MSLNVGLFIMRVVLCPLKLAMWSDVDAGCDYLTTTWTISDMLIEILTMLLWLNIVNVTVQEFYMH